VIVNKALTISRETEAMAGNEIDMNITPEMNQGLAIKAATVDNSYRIEFTYI
jgi:hypothetical protein